MKICAVSDLHGRLPTIPKCDLLIIAGDITRDADRRGIWGDPELMRARQMEILAEEFAPWADAVPAERIICTPGNHDWFDTFPKNVRAELFIDQLVEWQGKRFYLTPWVSPCGHWNYSGDRVMRGARFADIPDGLDVLIAHSPAYQLGDSAYGDIPAGCIELRSAIDRAKPRYVTFGHIHEGQRYGRTSMLGNTVLYNCAMWGEKWEPVVFDI